MYHDINFKLTVNWALINTKPNIQHKLNNILKFILVRYIVFDKLVTVYLFIYMPVDYRSRGAKEISVEKYLFFFFFRNLSTARIWVKEWSASNCKTASYIHLTYSIIQINWIFSSLCMYVPKILLRKVFWPVLIFFMKSLPVYVHFMWSLLYAFQFHAYVCYLQHWYLSFQKFVNLGLQKWASTSYIRLYI